MVSIGSFAAFTLIALGMVLTPGPNMIYLITRSLRQGRGAGFISLLGIVLGFVIYMLCAAFGLTALLVATPFVYEAIKWAGAAYLLFIAWSGIKPGARSAFEPRADLAVDGPGKLFAMGFLTSILNPKIAVLYLSLLPQFVDAARGDVLLQSLTFGTIQIVVSFSVNAAIVIAAGTAAAWFGARPRWLRAQRWVMSSLLGAMAVRLAFEKQAA